jgi:serine/threonine protein kinase
LTEYVAGGSLLKELCVGGLAIDIVRGYSQQLLKVLAYLHGESIVHKDIKVLYSMLYKTSCDHARYVVRLHDDTSI